MGLSKEALHVFGHGGGQGGSISVFHAFSRTVIYATSTAHVTLSRKAEHMLCSNHTRVHTQ